MSDLYSCSKSYKSIINTIKKNKPIENFEIEIQTPKGDKLSVLNTSKLIMYKGENCKITSLIDVTEEKKFKYLATIDELTGIRNRRSIMEFASTEFQRCKRYNRDFALMVIDLDFFKKINDKYGHAAGDQALIIMADEVSKTLRNEDIFGRIGGEEFAVVLPETDLKEAKMIAGRINNEIRKIMISASDIEFNFTASIGVTAISPKDNNIDETMHRADVALYNAKDNGRDNVYAVVDADKKK
ncbi:MAG: GGDEF domain-containing protein [Proteobacteria bacterium]|nr:GGDEF domain-containing protein [Pseudomonadota bacterium]